MKRSIKKLLALFLVMAVLFSFAGCGSSGGKNGELNIYVWTEYVPESVVKDFEKETGIKVNVSTYSSNEDMLAKVKAEETGAFDIVLPSDYMVEQMISQGLLQELDKTKLTNFKNLNSDFLNPSYDPGNVYSVPYLGGVGAIAVNTSKITDTISSYNDLFSTKYKKSLVVLDDFRAVIGITARSMGYTMNETDPATLEKVSGKLLTLKDNIKLYDSDSPKSALISGDCTLAFCWSAEIALAMEENKDIKIVYPQEGGFLFMDNWCITKGAKNSEAALKFIDYIMKAEVSKTVMEEYPYICPNSEAMKLMDDNYKNNIAKNIPTEVLKKGEYVENISTMALELYDDMWTNLKK